MTEPDAPGSSHPAPWVDGRNRVADLALELRHPDAGHEEWLFTSWMPGLGVISGYRIVGRVGWYWAAVVRPGEPLIHVTDWAVPLRSDPLLVKGDGLWAEHTCDAPMEQWTVVNETYATALNHPADALGRAYGTPTAVAFDIEWYAIAAPQPVPPQPSASDRRRPELGIGAAAGGDGEGYSQRGVVHAVIELAGTPGLRLTEAPALRWHRWGRHLDPVVLPAAFAHARVRAPFAFPDGTVADWVLTPGGWRARPT